MPQEVLLTTSSSPDSSILLHDLHNSNHVQSFRQSVTAQNGLTMTASKNQFLTAQLDRGIIHVYSWGKDTSKSKMILPEKIRSFKMSPSGTWCVGGSESGKLFLWEVHLDANRWTYIRSLAGICYLLEKHITSLSQRYLLLQMKPCCLLEVKMR